MSRKVVKQTLLGTHGETDGLCRRLSAALQGIVAALTGITAVHLGREFVEQSCFRCGRGATM